MLKIVNARKIIVVSSLFLINISVCKTSKLSDDDMMKMMTLVPVKNLQLKVHLCTNLRDLIKINLGKFTLGFDV